MSRTLLSELITPKLLKESAGDESCCIFRIGRGLRRANGKAYDPELVSIVPYHHGKEQLRMIEEHDLDFCVCLLKKLEKNNVSSDDLVKAVSKKEEAIRSLYSENLVELDKEKLIDMMILDGCYILMLFLAPSRRLDELPRKDDQIFRMPCILMTIMRHIKKSLGSSKALSL